MTSETTEPAGTTGDAGGTGGTGEPTAALHKRECAACGAPAEWHPGRQALVCPFCGTEAPVEPGALEGEVREIPLVETLRALPDDRRGWQRATRSVRCTSCRAISVFAAEEAGRNCDFCGSPQLVDYDEIKPPVRPGGVVPFRVPESRVRETIRAWFASKWLAPNVFEKRALVDTVRGVYVPFWTFDAEADCPWTAQSGTYYYTTETYRDAKGRARTRRVRHVRWRPAAGRVRHAFDDEPVPATRGLAADLLAAIGPFPTGEAKPYAPSFLAGFTVEHYQVVLIDAVRRSRESMHAQLRALCAAQVPGDTHRNLQIAPAYSAETFKHVLVPVWLLAYDFRGKAYQVLVNGATGRIAGRYPKSVWKLVLLGLLGVLVALAVIFGKQFL